jgi:hypothetical protein
MQDLALPFGCLIFLLYLVQNIWMRFLAYILSFVILSLTTYTCIDIPTGNTLQKIELSHSTSSNPHQSDTDHCSPLCACQCCQSSFFISYISDTFPSSESEIDYTAYSPAIQSIELSDFLIPPKSDS